MTLPTDLANSENVALTAHVVNALWHEEYTP